MNLLVLIDNFENRNIKSFKKSSLINWNRSLKNEFSIIKYIEDNDKFFKGKYLDLINTIKKKLFKFNIFHNKSFENNNNFSLWDMSIFEEKSIYKSPYINEIIKILALKEIVKKKKTKKIIIFSNNKNLKLNILSLIKDIEIEFNLTKTKTKKEKKLFRNNILYFTYYLLNFFLKRYRLFNPVFKLKKNSIMVYDYFAYFNKSEAFKNNFISSYWKKLIPSLRENNININFFHITMDEKNFDIKTKLNILNNLNKSKNMSHNIIDTQIDLIIFFKVITIFFKNYFNYRIFKLKNSRNLIFQNKILYQMFIDSYIGVWSIKNLFVHYMIQKYVKYTNENNKVVIYINEFQGWEKSLIYNLNKNKINNHFGIQFNPIRNWDLRYNFKVTKKNKHLFPNNIITFYSSSIRQISKNFYKGTVPKIFLTENLRPIEIKLNKFNKTKNKSILLLGDHDDGSTINLLNIVNNFKKLNFQANFEYKPHPISKINISNFKELKGIKVYKNNDCFNFKYYAYIVSNKTSLGLELKKMNIKTGIILDKENLNLSPVDKNHMYFIKNEIDLNSFINSKTRKRINSDMETKTKTPLISIIKLWKKKINNE